MVHAKEGKLRFPQAFGKTRCSIIGTFEYQEYKIRPWKEADNT